MMISPDTYSDLHENDTLKELIEERSYLIKELKHYENTNKEASDDTIIHPTPEYIYQMNLEYLLRLCSLMLKKVRKE